MESTDDFSAGSQPTGLTRRRTNIGIVLTLVIATALWFVLTELSYQSCAAIFTDTPELSCYRSRYLAGSILTLITIVTVGSGLLAWHFHRKWRATRKNPDLVNASQAAMIAYQVCRLLTIIFSLPTVACYLAFLGNIG